MLLIPLAVVLAAPGTIAQDSGVSASKGYLFQRKTFYDVGTSQHWAIIWNQGGGTHDLMYSADGAVWGLAVNGAAITSGNTEYNQAVYYDGTWVSVVVGSIYRRGLVGNGEITWAAVEQTWYGGAGSAAKPDITVDTLGFPWIIYRETADSLIYVTTSSTSDGTWNTAGGYPLALDVDMFTNADPLLLPFAGGDLLATWGDADTASTALSACYYDFVPGVGASWGLEEPVIADSNSADCSMTANGHGIAYLITRKGDASGFYYTERSAGPLGTWSAKATILTQASLTYYGLSRDDDNDTMYAIYQDAGTDTLYFQKSIRGTWDTGSTALVTDAANGMDRALQISQDMSTGVLGIRYFGTVPAPDVFMYEWVSRPTVTIQAETGVTMDRDGVTGGTFNYDLTGMGRSPSVDTWVRYDLASEAVQPYTYTYGTSVNTRAATGATTRPFSTSLTPGATYYYRAEADGWGWSAEDTFAMTMPGIATAAATNTGTSTPTLNGAVTAMGVATDCYVRFQWGYTSGALDHNTAYQVVGAAGPVEQALAGVDPTKQVYYQAQVRVGTTIDTSAETSFVPAGTWENQTQAIVNLMPLIFVALAIGMFVMAFMVEGMTIPGIVMAAIFLVMAIAGIGAIDGAVKSIFGG